MFLDFHDDQKLPRYELQAHNLEENNNFVY